MFQEISFCVCVLVETFVSKFIVLTKENLIILEAESPWPSFRQFQREKALRNRTCLCCLRPVTISVFPVIVWTFREMSCFGRDQDKLVYKPRVILITGGAGFIGSHVVSYLLREYPEYLIINYDKLDYCASLKNLSDVAHYPNYRFVKGDILSEDLVSYVLESHSVDTVIHMAAQTHVDASFGNSLFFTNTNVLGTHTLLECCRKYGRIGRFIHQSTDEIYGGEHEGMNTELSLPAPSNPYACSKAAAEFIAVGYYKSFGFPVMITRSNNVYGPRQYPDKLIPKSICLLQQGQKCFVHGDGKHRRNWLYADDAARAIDCILHRGVVGEIYNVGSDFECCTLDVIRDLLSLFGYTDDFENHIQFVRDRPYNDRRYRLDSTKLRSLGWQPLVPWKQGLQRTLEWYSSDNIHNWDEGFGFQYGLVSHPNHFSTATNIKTNDTV